MTDAAARPDMRHRIDAVKARVDIAGVIGGAIKLVGKRNPRGKCPFHGSKSDSFAVYTDSGSATCWGCGWRGDAIEFLRDYYSLSFVEALERLEAGAGLDGRAAAPIQRERNPVQRRHDGDAIDSIVMGRWLWRHARANVDAVSTYLAARGVPVAMLTRDRLVNVRFVPEAPIAAWREHAGPRSVPHAPAMVALVRRRDDDGTWRPIGVHVTWLCPDLTGKMVRRRADGSDYPARKMLGPVGGGAVLLPGGDPSGAEGIDPLCPLCVGEGIETTLSGIAMTGQNRATGLAVLSLDNLQGRWIEERGAIPLYDVRPDPERPPLCFPHGGPVTGLIDADMKPLAGPIDRATGRPRGMALIERRKGPVVRRTLTTAERAAICGALFVRAWRAEGCNARALRPRMGQDFNDAIRERAHG